MKINENNLIFEGYIKHLAEAKKPMMKKVDPEHPEKDPTPSTPMTKSDKYVVNKRKAISSAIKGKKKMDENTGTKTPYWKQLELFAAKYGGMDVVQQALERIEEEKGPNIIDAWKGGIIGMDEFASMIEDAMPNNTLDEARKCKMKKKR